MKVGDQVGEHRLREHIGAGGMGTVWLGEHVTTGARRAIKVLSPQLAKDESFRERFERESRYATALEHPNVVPVYGADRHGDEMYLVMAYVAGTDLRRLIDEVGKLEPARAMRILEQVADALDAVHEAGVLHRDVKPGNILVDPADGDHAYLTDFGLSKSPEDDTLNLTAAGTFVGTIDYIAPEQLLAHEVDRRADVYSLGCVLFETLVGRIPFVRERDLDVLYAHLSEPPPKPSEAAALPVELDTVIARAMAKEADARFPTCTALIEAAKDAFGGPGSVVDPSSPPVLVVRRGPAAGTTLEVPPTGELLIGRAAAGSGHLGHDPEISRRHAMLRQAGGHLSVEDLGSTNGTTVNGQPTVGVTPLALGDRLEVGSSDLEVVADAADAVPDAEPEPSTMPLDTADVDADLGIIDIALRLDTRAGVLAIELDGAGAIMLERRPDGGWEVR